MNEPVHQPLPEQAILRQAADWFARLSDEAATEQDTIALEQWLAQHPDHIRAWGYVQQVTGRFQQATDTAGKQGTRHVLQTAQINKTRRKLLVGGGLTGIALLLGWRYTPLGQQLGNHLLADYSTSTGTIDRWLLNDASQLCLNTATAVDVQYAETRHIVLHHGEILVETAQDIQQRPLIVTTRHGSLTALGTRFSVYQQSQTTLLAVFDGAVQIKIADGTEQVIQAGHQVEFHQQKIHELQPVQRARQAWTRGLLVADNIQLQDFIAELSRYQQGHVGVADEIADLQVIGVYPIDQPDHTLKMLANALPIEVSQPFPWWTEIQPRLE